jgi:hypothetical protein
MAEQQAVLQQLQANVGLQAKISQELAAPNSITTAMKTGRAIP